MTLTFHPQRGTIVFCDFTTGFIEPEMIKKRPVIVISGKENGGICSIVPISTKAPDPIREWHYLLPENSLPNALRGEENWVKCDMVTAVSIKRLDRIRDGRNSDGSRRYISHRIGRVDMLAIETGIIAALCLKHLTIRPT